MSVFGWALPGEGSIRAGLSAGRRPHARAATIMILIVISGAPILGAKVADRYRSSIAPSPSSSIVQGTRPTASPSNRIPPPANPARASTELAQVIVQRNLTYGSDRGMALQLDAYLATPRAARRPAVVVLHGGGWEGGDKADTASLSAALAGAGFEAFNIDYRLATADAPGYPFQINDAQAAVRWVRANASRLGVDPGRIGAIGVSAGAYLALELAAGTIDRSTGSGVAAVVSWSAPTDLLGLAGIADATCAGQTCPRGSLAGLWYWAVHDFLGCDPPTCSALEIASSPVNHMAAGGPPLMLWNSSDELVPASQEDELYTRARAVGERVIREELPGSEHGAQYRSVALARSISFLVSELGMGAKA